jgi:hypothetical protein
MARPTTRQEFGEHCLRRLGEPVSEINVSETQVDDRIDEALQKFYERHYDATELKYLAYVVSEDDVNQGYIQLTERFEGVSMVYRNGGGFSSSTGSVDSSLFDPMYQIQLSDYMSGNGLYRNGTLTFYYTSLMNLQLMNFLFTPNRQFNYSRISNRLNMLGMYEAFQAGEVIVIEAYIRLYGEDDGDDSNTPIYDNVWKDQWLQEYATALIMRQWGMNLMKFDGVPMLGGVTLNGDKIFQQGDAWVRLMEEKLQSEREEPLGFIVA